MFKSACLFHDVSDAYDMTSTDTGVGARVPAWNRAQAMSARGMGCIMPPCWPHVCVHAPRKAVSAPRLCCPRVRACAPMRLPAASLLPRLLLPVLDVQGVP